MQTMFERGMAEGQRKTVRMQLERRFGPLPPPAIERLQACSDDEIEEIATGFVDGKSLKELGLEG